MLLGEVDHVHRPIQILRQVVDVEVLRLVNHKEFTETAHELATLGVRRT